MERRRSKRIFVCFDAELVSGGVSYAGVIENLSEDGVYVETVPIKNATGLIPGKTLELKFQPLSGETLNLHCKVIWHKTPTHGLTNNIGMEIIDPPWERSEYFL